MRTQTTPTFDAQVFFSAAGITPTTVQCDVGQTIFCRGDSADSVIYVQKGAVQLSMVGAVGREAVIGMRRAGDFLGEGCLAGQRVRTRTATAITRSVVVVIDQGDMVRLLRSEHALSDRFIESMLARNARLEADLVDQIVSPCEQRLARTLLLLARYGKRGTRPKLVPRISQLALAGMVGATRGRINHLMNKFKRQGLVEFDGGGQVTVTSSLRHVILHDSAAG